LSLQIVSLNIVAEDFSEGFYQIMLARNLASDDDVTSTGSATFRQMTIRQLNDSWGQFHQTFFAKQKVVKNLLFNLTNTLKKIAKSLCWSCELTSARRFPNLCAVLPICVPKKHLFLCARKSCAHMLVKCTLDINVRGNLRLRYFDLNPKSLI
jgi:hypothetical protein